MRWYQVKEQAAGAKRLYILFMIHKLLGRNVAKFLVYFITFFAFLPAKEIRKYSAKYLKIIGVKPTFLNIYKHFLEYSLSLLDRIEVFSGKFSTDRISFADPNEKTEFDKDFDKGIFFICSHLGNIDVMRALLKDYPSKQVNVFLAKDQCKIFNDFLKTIAAETTIKTYPVEDIGIETSIEIEESLKNGAFVFIAGDRTSKQATNFKTKLFNQTVEFPLGTFKFAQLMAAPTYFVCALKDNKDNYQIHIKKFTPTGSKSEILNAMQQEYVNFLETKTPLAPLQFFHFYDLFEESKNL